MKKRKKKKNKEKLSFHWKIILQTLIICCITIAVVAEISNSSTTIGNNITTSGTLSVTGTSTFSGNVGIGTTAPGVKLDVVGTHVSGTGIARFKGDANAGFMGLDTTTAGEAGFLLKSAGTLVGQFGIDGVAERVYIKNRVYGTGEIVSITNTGNVGIGTITPGNKLEVNGSFRIHNASNSTLLYVNESNGNVGIGTTSPSTKLHIYGGDIKLDVTGGDRLYIGDSYISHGSGGTGALGLQGSGGNENIVISADKDAYFVMDSDDDETTRSFRIIKNSDWTSAGELMRVQEDGNVGIGTDTPGAKLDVNGDVFADAVVRDLSNSYLELSGGSAVDTGGNLIIYAENASARPNLFLFRDDTATRAKISTVGDFQMDGDLSVDGTGDSYIMGNVGIGTTGPGAKLDVSVGVVEATDDYEVMRLNRSVSDGDIKDNTSGYIGFQLTDQGVSDNELARIMWEATANTDEDSGELSFWTNEDGTMQQNMLINKSGNVGIGTTGPTELLHLAVDDSNFIVLDRTENVGIDDVANIGISNAGGVSNDYLWIGQTDADRDFVLQLDTGNVGIGTTGPQTGLHLWQKSYGYTSASGVDNKVFSFRNSADDERMSLNYNNTNVKLNIRDRNGSDLVTFNEDGNVGIGTTTPATLFDVHSTATTTITIDSNAAAKGSCLKLKDYDGSGYTYCVVNDGTLTCSPNSCE